MVPQLQQQEPLPAFDELALLFDEGPVVPNQELSAQSLHLDLSFLDDFSPVAPGCTAALAEVQLEPRVEQSCFEQRIPEPPVNEHFNREAMMELRRWPSLFLGRLLSRSNNRGGRSGFRLSRLQQEYLRVHRDAPCMDLDESSLSGRQTLRWLTKQWQQHELVDTIPAMKSIWETIRETRRKATNRENDRIRACQLFETLATSLSAMSVPAHVIQDLQAFESTKVRAHRDAWEFAFNNSDHVLKDTIADLKTAVRIAIECQIQLE